MRHTAAFHVRYWAELLYSLGGGVQCPFCGWTFRRFRRAGFAYPVILENHVVSAFPRPNVDCPRCLAHDRERLLYLFLKQRTAVFEDHLLLLHAAPEPQLQKKLRQAQNLRYITMDLDHPIADVHCDLMRLPFPDASVDAVICCHVLEHVQDDTAGMREICRALKPNGWAILQVPIALRAEKTVEDPSVTDPKERIRRFGQNDHVRLYSVRDYPLRLAESGFQVSVIDFRSEVGLETATRHALNPEERIYLCTKI